MQRNELARILKRSVASITGSCWTFSLPARRLILSLASRILLLCWNTWFFDIFSVTPLLFKCRSIELRKPRRAERLYSSPFFVLASTSNLARFRSNSVVFIPTNILSLRKAEFFNKLISHTSWLMSLLNAKHRTGLSPWNNFTTHSQTMEHWATYIAEINITFKAQFTFDFHDEHIFLSNISKTRDSVSSGYSNTERRVENTTCGGVFLTKFEVFG